MINFLVILIASFSYSMSTLGIVGILYFLSVEYINILWFNIFLIGIYIVDLVINIYKITLSRRIRRLLNSEYVTRTSNNNPILIIPLFKKGLPDSYIIPNLYIPEDKLNITFNIIKSIVKDKVNIPSTVDNLEVILLEINLPIKLSTLEYFHLNALTNLHFENLKHAQIVKTQ